MTLDNNGVELITRIFKDLLPLIYTLFGGVLTYFISRKNAQQKRKEEKLQHKMQILSKLNGMRFHLETIFYLNSKSYSKLIYYRAISNLRTELAVNRTNPNAVWIEISEREDIMSKIPETTKAENEIEIFNDTELNLGIALKELWEIIGLIQVSFDNCIKRDKLLDKFDKVLDKYNKFASVPSEIETNDFNKISVWMRDRNIKFTHYLENEFRPTYKELLDYLKAEIDKDAEAIDKTSESKDQRFYRICKFFCKP